MKVDAKLWTQHPLDQEFGDRQMAQRVALSSGISLCITGLCEPQFPHLQLGKSYLLCSVAEKLEVHITSM